MLYLPVLILIKGAEGAILEDVTACKEGLIVTTWDVALGIT